MYNEKAYFAAGCFWGVESIYLEIKGVKKTTVGYMNGKTSSPSYQDICTGTTHHTEAVELFFDNAVVTFDQLVWLFWHLHDPTQVNRQGPDVGTQYRSGIYVSSPLQYEVALKSKAHAQPLFHQPIATEILPAETFWEAETYHQQYFIKHPWKGSCHLRPDIDAILKAAPLL